MNAARTGGRLAGTVAVVAALVGGLAACGGGSTAAPAAPAAAPAVSPIQAVCGNLLKLDAVPAPDGGPDGPPPAEAVKEYGAAAAPLLDAALAQAPAELSGSLTTLKPFITAAATSGTAPDFEDPAFTGSIAGYEKWAYDSCGYQQVSLMGEDFTFAGAPATLKAGPVSIQLMNHTRSDQFHVALLAKPKNDSVTLEQFVQTPFEGLTQIVDLVPGAASAAPGQSGGLLVDLTPGRYFLVCPVGDAGEQPHHLRGMINEITVT